MEKITFIYEFEDSDAQRKVQHVMSPGDAIKWQDALDEFLGFLSSAGYSQINVIDVIQHLNKQIYMQTAAPSYYGAGDNAPLPD